MCNLMGDTLDTGTQGLSSRLAFIVPAQQRISQNSVYLVHLVLRLALTKPDGKYAGLRAYVRGLHFSVVWQERIASQNNVVPLVSRLVLTKSDGR